MNLNRAFAILLVGTGLVFGGPARAYAEEQPAAGGHGYSAEPSSVHAESNGHNAPAHSDATPAILTGDLGNMVWTTVIFVVLLLVLWATAWKPILKALQGREQFITESIAAAKRERLESERMMREYTEKMNKARDEATAIVEEGRHNAEALRRKIHEDTKKEAAEMMARAQKEIKIAKDSAVAALYQQVVEVSTNLADRIVRKQLTPADHRGLLDESIAEVAKLKN